MTNIVIRLSEFEWKITCCPRDATVHTMINLKYDVKRRRFHGEARRRYSHVSPWHRWKNASPEQIALARAAIGEKEVARCLALSIIEASSQFIPSPLAEFEEALGLADGGKA